MNGRVLAVLMIVMVSGTLVYLVERPETSISRFWGPRSIQGARSVVGAGVPAFGGQRVLSQVVGADADDPHQRMSEILFDAPMQHGAGGLDPVVEKHGLHLRDDRTFGAEMRVAPVRRVLGVDADLDGPAAQVDVVLGRRGRGEGVGGADEGDRGELNQPLVEVTGSVVVAPTAASMLRAILTAVCPLMYFCSSI